MINRLKNFLFTNSSIKQAVLKNTFWLFIGEIFGRIIKLGLVVYATRLLGAEGWGAFSYGLAFVSLFYIFADIGINIFVTRELSKEKTDQWEYIPSAFILKVSLLLLSFIVSIILIPKLGSKVIELKIILAIALFNFSESLREFALSINRAFQRMEREALVKIVAGGATAALGIYLLSTYSTPLSLATAYAGGSIIASVASLWTLPSEFRKVRWTISWSKIKTIFIFAWPFIATVIFSTALVTVDSIMLGNMKSTTEVGLYTAAQRIIQFLAIIPIFIGISLFPIMSKNDPETLRTFFEKAMVIVFALAIPIAIGGLFLSQQLMLTIFGPSFIGGGLVLGILMFVVFADFPFIILNNVISIKNLQRKFIISTIIGLVLNIALNIYLIPLYGAVGAAISTVAAQLLIMIINWQILKIFFSFTVIPKLWRISLCTIIMAIAVALCTTFGSPIIVSIIVAIIVYTSMLYLLKEPALAQILSIIKRQ